MTVGLLADTFWLTWLPGVVIASLAVLALLGKAFTSLSKIHEALPALYRIEHEFSPNSGTSMRDQIDELRDDVRAAATKTLDTNASMRRHIDDDKQAFSRQDRWNLRTEKQLDRIEQATDR